MSVPCWPTSARPNGDARPDDVDNLICARCELAFPYKTKKSEHCPACRAVVKAECERARRRQKDPGIDSPERKASQLAGLRGKRAERKARADLHEKGHVGTVMGEWDGNKDPHFIGPRLTTHIDEVDLDPRRVRPWHAREVPAPTGDFWAGLQRYAPLYRIKPFPLAPGRHRERRGGGLAPRTHTHPPPARMPRRSP